MGGKVLIEECGIPEGEQAKTGRRLLLGDFPGAAYPLARAHSIPKRRAGSSMVPYPRSPLGGPEAWTWAMLLEETREDSTGPH